MQSKCSSEMLTPENLPVVVLRHCPPLTQLNGYVLSSQPSACARAPHSLLLTPGFGFCKCPGSPGITNSLPLS